MSEKSINRWHEARLKHGEAVGGGWFVFRRGRTTGRLKINPQRMPFEHGSRDKAEAEAARLAADHVGISFCVFHMESTFRAKPVELALPIATETV